MKIYLDLLPEQKKNAIKRNKLFRAILRGEALFLLPVIFFVIILGNIYYVLTVQHSATVAISSLDKSQDKYQQLSSYENTFTQVNSTVAALSKIQSSQFYWSNVLASLANAVPGGVTISELSNKDYQMFVVGKALSRDDLLTFQSQLQASACFQNVDVPLSDLVVKDDVAFQLDFVVAKDCLNKK